jgi:hypothetical protein
VPWPGDGGGMAQTLTPHTHDPDPTAPPDRERPGPVRRAVRAWTAWTPYAAALWSLAYCALAATWALGGRGYPFDRAADPGNDSSLLWRADREVTAAVIAVLCLAGVAVAGIVARRDRGFPSRPLARAFVAFGALAAVALTVVVPDQRVLTAIGYLPIVAVGWPWDFPPVSYTEALPWPVQNQLLLMLGGVLWATTATVAARRGSAACECCGRPDGDRAHGHWTSPEGARRWGRVAVGVAVVIPVLYALDRLAWLAGINLGVSDELISDVRDTDLRYAALGLALGAIGGAVLTLGLAQRWGEVFPRWIPVLRGRRVPPALAIVPATFVAIAVTSAGLTVVRLLVTERDTLPTEDIGAVVPMAPWPLWGLALAAATLAYHLRRRGPCPTCHRR